MCPCTWDKQCSQHCCRCLHTAIQAKGGEPRVDAAEKRCMQAGNRLERQQAQAAHTGWKGRTHRLERQHACSKHGTWKCIRHNACCITDGGYVNPLKLLCCNLRGHEQCSSCNWISIIPKSGSQFCQTLYCSPNQLQQRLLHVW